MLTLLNNPYNYTFTFITLMLTDSAAYYRGQDGWPSGTIADYTMKAVFLEDPEAIRKSGRVKFLWADQTGSRNPENGSWDGASALGMLADPTNPADAFIKPMDYYSVPGEIVNPSGVLFSFNYILVHTINERNLVQSLMDLVNLLIPSFELLKIAVYGILAYRIILFSFLFCLWKFFKKPKKTNLQIKILAFAYLMYWFWVDQFYNAIISTESVTVDLSDLLHSEEQILSTKKAPCFFEAGIEMETFKGAPKTTLAYKIYEKRNRTKTCYLLERDAPLGHLMTSGVFPHSFTLIADVATEIGTKLFQAMAKQATYTNMNPIIESVRTLVFKKSFKKELKKFFDFGVNLYASYGIFQKGVQGFSEFQREAVPKTGGPDGFMNYFSLNEYIEDHSEVVPLKFVQLDYLFRIYFAVLALFLFFNMAHCAQVRLVDPIKRLMVKMLLWLVASTLPFRKWRIHPDNQ